MAVVKIIVLVSLLSSYLLIITPTQAALEDIFGSFFGGGGQQQQQQQGRGGGGGHRHVMNRGGQQQQQGQQRTPDARTAVAVTLNDLYLGTTRELSYQRNVLCTHCHGTGAKDGATKRCTKCQGRGHVIVEQQVMPGFRMQTQQTCPKCHGKGQMFAHKCPFCRGEGVVRENTHIDLTVDAGMKHGQEIRFPGKSEESPGHSTGDLVAVLEMEKHSFFQRYGNDLKTAVELSLTQALLGYDLNIQHLDERWINLKSTDISSHKQEREYKNEGMPHYRRPRKHGKLTIEYRVKFPKSVNQPQVQKLKNIFADLSMDGEYII